MPRAKVVLPAMIALFILGIAAAAEQPAKPAVVSVAVLDFQASGAKLAELGPQSAALLNAALSNNPDLILVERQELEKLLNNT